MQIESTEFTWFTDFPAPPNMLTGFPGLVPKCHRASRVAPSSTATGDTAERTWKGGRKGWKIPN